MGLIDSLQAWLSRKPQRAGAPLCPPESDILKYKENHLPTEARERLEQHVADCQDCRELLVLLARFPEEEIAQQPPLSNAEIQQQIARVIQFIEEDERRKTRVSGGQIRPEPQAGWAYRYQAQLGTALVMVCALVIGGVYLMTSREPATDAARHSLELAMKEERRSPARFSGGFEYSAHKATRGSEDSPELYLKIALNQLKSAEDDNAPVEMRQMLARAHLAFYSAEHARRAQTILEGLQARGVQTAEVLNDLGVAQFQLQSYDAAIASFSRALEINPAYTEALFNRALAKESATRYPEALRDWDQFLHSTTDVNWKSEAERHIKGLSSESKLMP